MYQNNLKYKIVKKVTANNTWSVTTDGDYRHANRCRIRLESHDEYQKKNYSVLYCISLHSVYSGWEICKSEVCSILECILYAGDSKMLMFTVTVSKLKLDGVGLVHNRPSTD